MAILKRTLALFLISMLAVSAWAERVSQDDAATVANNFMNAGASQSGAKKAPAKRMVLKKAAQAEESQFYVYENADGEGWVMVAANDVVQPILAYSKTGQFNVNNQPSNVKVWLGGYNKQIKFAEENNIKATEEVKTAWRKLRTSPPVTAMGNVVVAPLIKTTWDQDDPYWKYCPKKGSTNTYVGCVATAMAQVMNYWKWPDQGEGSYSYTSDMNSLSCSADFGSTTYDWANMVDHYTTYYSGSSTISVSTPTTAQKDAVATLMYHCGVAVEMDYGTSSQGGSGAQTIYPNASQTNLKCAANALWNNFRYKKSTLKCYYRSGGYGYSAVNDATWLNLLKTELDAARPIMYAGADNEGGHSFVCDGYDDQNYFHFNWGWSGYCDGYYTVNNMVPGTGGSGAGNGSYNDDQDIIIGIIPDKPDVTITWSIQGVTSTTTQTSGTLVLPTTTPSDCSGAGGKKFVGWTANSTITGGARPSDLFTSGSGITVTENKTYYAVYATASGSGGGGTSGNVTITTSTANIPTSYGSANTFTEYTLEGYKFKIQQMYLNSGKLQWRAAGNSNGTGTMYNNETFPGKITSIVLTYNSSDANKNFTVKVGNAANPSSGTSITPTISGSVYTFDCSSANADYFVLTNGSGAGYLDQIVINYGGGGGTSYSDYSLVCGTPCSNTPSMSFTNETVNKTTADVTYTQAVTITGKGSGQTVAYSSSDESVATVNSSGVVTLQGIVGSTTITASVLADGDYCAASASYTLNVTAAPIDVTLYYNGTSTTLANQANPYTLPTGSPYNTAMCSGDWTFVGWYSSAYSKSTTAPTYITQLTATSSAYAVYTTTETSGSGGSSEVASVTFANASSDGSADKSGSISDLVASASGISSYSGSKVYAGTTGIKIGSGSAVGSITITLSSAADVKTVKVTAKKYGSDTGTLSVKAGDTSIGSAQAPPASTGELTFTAESAVTNASTITVATSSKRAYIASITVIADGGGTTTTYYATSPDCAGPPVPTYTVLWKACGETFKSETYAEGAALVLPNPAPAENAGKSFAGWTTTEHYTGASAPTLISAGGAVNADATYYAVFH